MNRLRLVGVAAGDRVDVFPGKDATAIWFEDSSLCVGSHLSGVNIFFVFSYYLFL